jgi:hypothetical protein
MKPSVRPKWLKSYTTYYKRLGWHESKRLALAELEATGWKPGMPEEIDDDATKL